MKTFDLAIVGGGIVGLMAAVTARASGASVLLCEASIRPSGASVRNFGQIVPSGQSTGLWRSLGDRSVAIYRTLSQRWNLPLRRGGSLYVASDDDELQLLGEMQAFNNQHGYLSTLLGPGATHAQQPGLAADYVKGGLFYPEEMTADSPALLTALARALAEDPDCELRMGCRIRDIDEVGSVCRLVSAEGFVMEAAQVLMAPGTGLSGPLAHVLLEAGLRICRLQMMSTDPMPGLKLDANLLTGLSIRRYPAFQSCPSRAAMVTPQAMQHFEQAGVHLLFTQRADGSLIVGDSHAWMAARDVDGLDYRIDMALNALMLDEARRILGLEGIRVRETWNGYYSEHPDGLLARSLGPRIHVLTGIGGKGMTTGPAVAERVTRSILDGENRIDELFVD